MAPNSATAPANENAPLQAIDQNGLTLADLARGVLSREFRPRTASVRRLAEAVLADDGRQAKPDQAKPKKKKKKKSSKADGGRKLAKIPGQKDRKKA